MQNAEKELEEVKVGDEESDEVCELCGRRMVIKYGPHGRFLAMSGLSGMPQYQTLLRKNRRSMPQVWQGYRPEKRHKEGRKVLWLYRQPGVAIHGMAEASNEKCPVCGPFFWKRATNSYARRRAAVLSKRRKKKKTARDKFVEEQKR